MTIREITTIIGYAAWWAVGGWVLGIGVNAAFGVDVAMVCALGNVIAGLFLLLPVLRNEELFRKFVYGPRHDEEGSLYLGLLWAFPFGGIFVGIYWWLLGRFG